jgi:hypothetical protein
MKQSKQTARSMGISKDLVAILITLRVRYVQLDILAILQCSSQRQAQQHS